MEDWAFIKETFPQAREGWEPNDNGNCPFCLGNDGAVETRSGVVYICHNCKTCWDVENTGGPYEGLLCVGTISEGTWYKEFETVRFKNGKCVNGEGAPWTSVTREKILAECLAEDKQAMQDDPPHFKEHPDAYTSSVNSDSPILSEAFGGMLPDPPSVDEMEDALPF